MSGNLNKLVQPECGGPNPLVAAAKQIATAAPRFRGPSGFVGGGGGVQQLQGQLNFAKEFAQSREPPPLLVGGSKPGAVSSAHVIQQQQQQLQLQQSTSVVSNNGQQQQTLNMINHMTAHPRLAGIHQQQGQQQGVAASTSSSSISAGDQLETKYRNDMMAAEAAAAAAAAQATTSASARASTGTKDSAGKLDDVQFWQSLSQAYMGPETTTTSTEGKAAGRPRWTARRTGGMPGQRTSETTGDQQATKQEVRGERASLEDLEQLGGMEAAAELMESMRLDEMAYAFDERNPLKDQFEDPFAEGLKRLEQGDIPSAALLFEAAVQREPENAQAWRYLGTTQAQNEMDKSAIRALRNCLRLQPSDQEARLAVAVSLVNETQHREACRHLLEWLMGHERYGRGAAAGANAERLQTIESEMLASQKNSEDITLGENTLAEEEEFRFSLLDEHIEYVRARFVEAARMAPNDPDPEVQSALGVLFNMRGDYAKAVDCFKAALSVRQQDSLLWNRLGATLANGNKSDEAVIAYRRALEISPGFLRSRYNLAISLIHLNLYEEAAKQLIQILNTQAAGQGAGAGSGAAIRTRSITSTSIWNTLRTVATLMNKPDLYPTIDGRDLDRCNQLLLVRPSTGSSGATG